MNNKNVTCRPCKEENNWEIKEPNGQVSNTHYATKQSCVAAGRKMAEEFGCELIVDDVNTTANKTTNMPNKNNNFNRNNDIY